MSITCSVNGCIHNDGSGGCELSYISISDAYDGQPICQEADFPEEDYSDDDF